MTAADTTDDVDPIDRLRTYYDRVDDGDVDGLLSLFAEDVRYDRPGREPIEGIDALRRFYERDRPLDDGTHDVHHVVVDGPFAAVRGEFTGRLDGKPVSFGFADHHEFDDDGLIATRYTYTDRDAV